MRRNRGASVILLCCLASNATPGNAQGKPEDTLKIGVSGPFTGGSSPMGESMRNGIRLAVEEINGIGGVNGRKIELIERDDRAEPDAGAKIAAEFTSRKVVAAIGIVNTGVGLASIDAYQKAKIPLILAVATGTSLTKKYAPPAAIENYIFRVAPTLDQEAQTLAADLQRRGLKKVAMLADATAYGAALPAFLGRRSRRDDEKYVVDGEGQFWQSRLCVRRGCTARHADSLEAEGGRAIACCRCVHAGVVRCCQQHNGACVFGDNRSRHENLKKWTETDDE